VSGQVNLKKRFDLTGIPTALGLVATVWVFFLAVFFPNSIPQVDFIPVVNFVALIMLYAFTPEPSLVDYSNVNADIASDIGKILETSEISIAAVVATYVALLVSTLLACFNVPPFGSWIPLVRIPLPVVCVAEASLIFVALAYVVAFSYTRSLTRVVKSRLVNMHGGVLSKIEVAGAMLINAAYSVWLLFLVVGTLLAIITLMLSPNVFSALNLLTVIALIWGLSDYGHGKLFDDAPGMPRDKYLRWSIEAFLFVVAGTVLNWLWLTQLAAGRILFTEPMVNVDATWLDMAAITFVLATVWFTLSTPLFTLNMIAAIKDRTQFLKETVKENKKEFAAFILKRAIKNSLEKSLSN